MSIKSALAGHFAKTFITLALLMGTIAGSVLFCLYTLSGAKLAIGAANLFSPYKLEYQAINGHLAGELNFSGLNIHGKEMDVSITELSLTWKPKALLKKHMTIQALRAKGLTYKPIATEKTTEPSKPFSLEDLKASLANSRIKVHELDIYDIKIQTEVPLHIDKFSLRHADTDGKFLVKTMALEGPFGHIFVHGGKALKASFDLSIPDLSVWSNRLKGDFKGHGTLSVTNLIDWMDTSYLSATLESNHLTVNETQIDGFSFKTKGTLSQFDTVLKGQMGEKHFHIPFDISFKDNTWHLNLNSAKVKHPSIKIPPIEGHASLTLGAYWRGSVAIDLGDNQVLHGKWTVAPLEDYELDGMLFSKFNDLNKLAQLLPNPKAIAGQSEMELLLGGTLKQPKLSGNLTLKKVELKLKELGTTLKIAKLELKSLDQKTLLITGHGTLGQGSFSIEGKSNLKAKNLDLDLVGNQLTIMDLPEYYIIGSPNLNFHFADGQPTLEGALHIDKAKLNVKEPQNTVSISPDVVVVQNKQTPIAKPEATVENPLQKLRAIIEISLGEEVHFKGFGAETELEGKLQVRSEPNHPMKATGKIIGKGGTYKTHGKKLTLATAQLIYADAVLSNPSLDFKAYRTIQAHQVKHAQSQDFFNGKQQAVQEGPIEVGLTLKGTLRAPVLKLYSVPNMSEGDVLSYLILEKPQQAASITEAKLLLVAGNELLYQFGKKVENNGPSYKERLDLDKLEVQFNPSEDGRTGLEQAALVFGKQFSNKFYVEVSNSLDVANSSIHLRYMINRHMTFETSASKNEISADLLFIFESG